MPAHSFMLADVAGCLFAVCLFPLFVLLPGFATAWLTDLYDFRRRTGAFQIALSIPLSIAICPVIVYLAGRFLSSAAVWAIFAATWAYVLALVARRRVFLPRLPSAAAMIFGAWAAIAILALIDLQIGHRAWFPAAAFDYSVRAQFIHAIGAGIPPVNPFFYPGHPVPLRYHYFWLLLCSLVDRAGGTAVTPRHAWIGGVVWCGFGFLALIALYFRLVFYRGPASFQRRAMIGMLLTGVTGLDILPTAVLWGLQYAGMRGVLPSMEWWNEQVDGFFYTAIWESHYLAGLIACLMAFLILCDTAKPRRNRTVALAALALASAAGTSVYVFFVFGLFLLLWAAVEISQRRWRETAALVCAGICGLVLLLPYAASLRGPAQGGPALQFWTRPFYPVDGLFRGQGIAASLTLDFVNGLALPLNYFLELGFFFVAAQLWWKRHRATRRPLARADLAIGLMIATSVLICTFLRSSVIGNNDLGWRGFLVAQFGLLLWAVDIFTDPGQSKRALLVTLMALGAAGSVYEFAINRFYPLLADQGVVSKVSWIAPDRQAGARNYAIREAAEWVQSAIPTDARIQFNPHSTGQNTSAYLYFQRQMLAGDDRCASTFGGDPALCPPVIAALDGIYPIAGSPATRLDEACRTLPAELVVALDTDPAWNDRHSWVWNTQPVFKNQFVRLFRCGSLSGYYGAKPGPG